MDKFGADGLAKHTHEVPQHMNDYKRTDQFNMNYENDNKDHNFGFINEDKQDSYNSIDDTRRNNEASQFLPDNERVIMKLPNDLNKSQGRRS